MFREHTTIQVGTESVTYVDNNVIMLRGSYVAHDCVIEEGVTLSVNSVILGKVHVMKQSNCGSGCLIHQHQVVGSWSMIGMGCVVPKKVRLEPGHTWVGNPARRLKTNMYALEKNNIEEYELIEETARYTQLVNVMKEYGL
jgi:UDP-N-acetylglucosamine acyltransferase